MNSIPRISRLTAAALLVAATMVTSHAEAAFVTTNEAAMDGIFSQLSFGNRPVDIMFNPTIVHNDANLLNINTPAKLNSLFALFGPSPTVFAYFVDTVDECGGFNVGFVGCGSTPGNDFVVESVFASGALGAELMAHELGHNLNLGHTPSVGNLMDPTINGNTSLTQNQVDTILSSPLVQGAVGTAEFIKITQVLITGTPPVVPLPSAAGLGLALLGALFVQKMRSRRKA